VTETQLTLTEKNNYITPADSKLFLARLSPALVFYPKMINVIIKGARLGRKGQYTGQEWLKSSSNLLKAMEAAGGQFIIENLDIVRNLDTPCVFVANHMSTMETLTLPAMIQPYRPVTFVIKKSLSTMPVFKDLMMARNPIVVGRSNPREDLKTMLNEGSKNLQEGTSIIIFPQTTRSLTFDPATFNSIGVKVAKKSGVPVVPIALKTDAMLNGKLVKDMGKLDISKPLRFNFGQPIDITGNGRDVQQKIISFISGKLAEWK